MMLSFSILLAPVISLSATAPLPCQPASVQPNWPTYHIVNNVTAHPGAKPSMRNLNDANAIFLYKGVYHVMNQAGGGIWTHAVSTDLAHWAHIPDALVANKTSTWDYQGPCDGTASFPRGAYGFDGTVPIIMYGPDCGQPLGPHPLRLGDTPRVEPAIPKDPSDPYLREWIKTEPGPVKFDGVPCSFPGRVWKSKVGNYFNMVCAYGGRAPWARYTSTDPKLMEWKVADTSFTKGIDKNADAGALFHKIPNADPDGPTHMINTNTGSAFYLGNYNSSTEVFTVTDSDIQVIDSASRYHWAASGNDGPDPDNDSGRLLTVSWVSNSPSVISLIRELSYDRASKQLVSNPVPEYLLLHNGTFLEGKPLGTLPPGSSKALPYPGASGGASDTMISFDPSGWNAGISGFGVAARVASSSSASLVDAAFVVNFSASVPDANGTRLITVRFVEPRVTPPSPGPNNILPYMNATDLGSGDYKSTHMPPNTDPHVCQAACLKDPACMVWTYVIRGSPPGSGDCIFKSAKHHCPSHNSKCTSGNGHGPSKCTPPVPQKGGGTKTFPLLKGETLDVRMLVDRPLTEVFVNGGRAAYTFADDTFSVDRTGVSVFNSGSDVISVSNASAYSMGCGWYAD